MKKNNFFLKGILALMLVFAFILTGCPEEDPETTPEAKSSGEPPSGNVSLPAIGNPVVTERILSNGIRLTWPPVMEAGSYQVWRNGGNQTGPRRLTTLTANNNEELITFNDLRSGSNEILPNVPYTYTVYAIPLSPVKDIGRWEKVITTYTPLFGDTATFTVVDLDVAAHTCPAASDIVTGFYASIKMNEISALRGTTYSVQKTILDAKGNPTTWTDVTLSSSPDADISVGTPTVDIFGNLSFALGTVYDRSLPFKEAKYRYRLRGTRTSDNITEYINASSVTVVDFKDYILSRLSLTIDTKDDSDSANSVYKITPGYTGRRNFLQTIQLTGQTPNEKSDKVVLYYLIGDKEDCYKTGPYMDNKIVTFTKNDLESGIGGGTVTTRDLKVPIKVGTQYLYVQAWLECADGEKYPLKLTGNWKGLGLLNSSNPTILNNEQYHVRLSY
jgi:hypothetical protein